MNQTQKLRYKCEWSLLDWKTIERAVFKLQKRIYRASSTNNKKAVRHLQRLLLASNQAKLLSVRRVTQDNRGKKTPGVDGIASLTPAQRLKLAEGLRLDEKTMPIRRIWIDKPGKSEKRPLGIPTISERAKQALLKMAMEPEWEARFEPNSYGFRPGRSCHDAISAIASPLTKKKAFVLDADISGCFDNIDHMQLLKKVNASPRITRIIKLWLKAGIVDKGFPPKENESGTPQGGILSPLLCNIALHGMENDTFNYMKKDLRQYNTSKWGSQGNIASSIAIIRYADDFVVIHENFDMILKAKEYIIQWLSGIGLELKPTKTRICHTYDQLDETPPGFNFLGFNIRQFSDKTQKKQCCTRIRPSNETVKKHLYKLKVTIKSLRGANQEALISGVNPIIRGWSNYYKYSAFKVIANKIAHLTFYKIWRWAVSRHAGKGRKWIKKRYFRTVGKNNWAFKTAQGHQLHRHDEWNSLWFSKVKGCRSVYDGDFIYWATRLGRYTGLSTRTAELLKVQKGKCPHCSLFFKSEDLRETHHKDKNHQNNRKANLVLLHAHCHDSIHRNRRGVNDNHQIVEEPDAVKATSPVLKPSTEGDLRT